jgi:hypothetical protein
VSVEGDQGKPNIEFTQDGLLKAAELKIMNLRPGLSKQLVWEEVSALFQYESVQACAPMFKILQTLNRIYQFFLAFHLL